MRSVHIAAFAVALGVIGGLAPGGASAAGWSGPRVVDSAAGSPWRFSLSGEVLFTGDNKVLRSIGRHDSAFAAPTPVLTQDRSELLLGLGADARDLLTVMTLRVHKPYARVRILVRAPDGTSIPARTISSAGRTADEPELAVAADGTAVAAWVSHYAAGWRVEAALRRPGGSFGPPQVLSEKWNNRIAFLTVAAGDGGHAAVSWSFEGSYRHPSPQLRALTTRADGAFGRASVLDSGAGHYDGALTVDARGRAVAAWAPIDSSVSDDREPALLKVAAARPGESFGASRTLSGRGTQLIDGGRPVATSTPDGGVVVAWVRSTRHGIVEAYSAPPGGEFAGAQVLSDGSRDPSNLTISAGSHGTVALGWADGHFAPDYEGPKWQTRVTVRPPGVQRFPPARLVSDPGHNGLFPRVGVAPDGGVAAAWIYNDVNSSDGQVAAAVWDPSG